MGTNTRLRGERSRVRIQAYRKNFSSQKCPDRLSTQPLVQWGPEIFPGIQRPGREADNSYPPSAKVRNKYSYIFAHSNITDEVTTKLVLFSSVRKINSPRGPKYLFSPNKYAKHCKKPSTEIVIDATAPSGAWPPHSQGF